MFRTKACEDATLPGGHGPRMKKAVRLQRLLPVALLALALIWSISPTYSAPLPEDRPAEQPSGFGRYVALLTVAALLTGWPMPLGTALDEATPESTRIEMLGTHFTYPEWPEAHSGEKWWGLYETTEGEYALIETTITISEEYDACLDTQATFISIDQEKPPVFLVRGSDRFTAGPVNTVAGYTRLLPGDSKECMFKESSQRFQILALGTAVWQKYPRINDYTINILKNDGRIFQEVLRVPETSTAEEFPVIWWMGDLDRDGELDLLIDEQPYPGGTLILYLSSEAGVGEIVAKVAELVHASC